MQLTIESRESVVVVIADGSITAQTAPALKQQLVDLIRDGRNDIILDMTKVDFVDSSGLGVIVGAFKQVRVGNGDLRLAGLCSTVRKVFELTRLDRVFATFDTVDAAVAEAA